MEPIRISVIGFAFGGIGLERWLLVLHFDAERFQQSTVLDATGAGGFAASAIEAGIEMSADGGGEFEPAINDGSHQVDPASRAIIFVTGFDVGGAGSRAESTVDTVEKPIVGNGLSEFCW